MKLYDDEAIEVTEEEADDAQVLDQDKLHATDGEATTALMQVTGGVIIWRAQGDDPVLSDHLGMVVNDGQSFTVNGIGNLDDFKFHKVSGTPWLYVAYGR